MRVLGIPTFIKKIRPETFPPEIGSRLCVLKHGQAASTQFVNTRAFVEVRGRFGKLIYIYVSILFLHL